MIRFPKDNLAAVQNKKQPSSVSLCEHVVLFFCQTIHRRQTHRHTG